MCGVLMEGNLMLFYVENVIMAVKIEILQWLNNSCTTCVVSQYSDISQERGISCKRELYFRKQMFCHKNS